ncbi:MAG: component of the Lpt lipopolysaccharide transport system [Pseudomonadota bacterium]|jgi:lipopolysaccharide export system protein LptA
MGFKMRIQDHLKRKQLKATKDLLLLAILIVTNIYAPAYARQQSPGQTIYFESDTLLYNNEAKLGIYQGHIKLTQGTRVLTADYATSYSDKKGQIVKVVAIGNPARYCAVIFPNHPQLIATGNTIYYYPLQDYLEAVGNAEIVQGQNHVKGPKINYDFKKKTVGSSISKEGHTQILLAPLQQSIHS